VSLAGVVRDVVIVWALTSAAGFVIGLAIAGSPTPAPQLALVIALSNMIFGTVGFVISGCLARGDRWRHLAYVALGVWVTGLVNVVVLGATLRTWVLSALFVVVMMGLGGAISYVFKRAGARER
jgi:uncharacterized membrane protein AbrB (regulator of aidB expression)